MSSCPLPRACAGLLILLLLMGCDGKDEDRPPPVPLSENAVGYYCGMLLSEHAGPKGEIRLASRAEPVWFSSARDLIAFMRNPLEPRDIQAAYVSDMARAQDWDHPGADNWVVAADAWYVIGSSRQGGMGAPETVPFGTEEAAKGFAAREGGKVARLGDIPDAYVLGGGDQEPEPVSHEGHSGHGGGGS